MLGLGLALNNLSILNRGGRLPLLPLNSKIAFEGDSITAGSSGPTFIQFALSNSLGRYYAPVGYNQGTGGQTAAQMATQVSQVTALSPNVVHLLAGTNDLSGTSDTPATIFANIRTCVTGYQSAGAKVIVSTVMPRNDATWTGLGVSREPDRLALNALIKGQTDVAVVDLESIYDPTTMSVDGLHPNYLGAINIGNAIAIKLSQLIVVDTPILHSFDAGNILITASKNPQLTGTTGVKNGTVTPTGEVAAGWTVQENGGMTVVASKTTLNGNAAQRVVVSGTNSTNGRVVAISCTCPYSGAIGELYETWWDFKLAGGSQNLRSVFANCDTTQMPNSSQTNLMPSVQLQGVLRPPNLAALTAADTSTSVQAVLTFAAGTVAADFTVAAPYFGKVVY